MSEKLPEADTNKEITFRLEFDITSRLRWLGIWFMIPPKSLKIESTSDKKYWETVRKYEDSPVLNFFFSFLLNLFL